MGVTSAPSSTRLQSRLYLDTFNRMHLLFTQVHLLFDSSAEGQYVTIDNVEFSTWCKIRVSPEELRRWSCMEQNMFFCMIFVDFKKKPWTRCEQGSALGHPSETKIPWPLLQARICLAYRNESINQLMGRTLGNIWLEDSKLLKRDLYSTSAGSRKIGGNLLSFLLTQGHMKGAPNETRTHLCMFASWAW